jgi:hypothetical protein
MQVIRLNSLAVLIVGALGASAVGAQNVVFTNSNNPTSTPQGPYTIPLQSGQHVSIAPNGDIRAQCVLASGSQRCAGIPEGTVVNPDPVGAAKVGMSTEAVDADANLAGIQIANNTAFSLNVAPSSNSIVCLRSANTSVGAWDGAVLPGAAPASGLQLGVGSYTFNVKCFNDAGSGTAPPISIQVVQGTGGGNPDPIPTGCTPDSSGFFPPTDLTTGQVYQGIASTDMASLWDGVTVQNSLQRITMAAGQYRSYRLTRSQFPAETSVMYGDGSHPGPGGAQFVAAEWRHVSISTCPGDFRLAELHPGSSDPTMNTACRRAAGEGPSVVFNWGAPHENYCNLDPNKTYYLNITFAYISAPERAGDPVNGFSMTEGCAAGSVCFYRVNF